MDDTATNTSAKDIWRLSWPLVLTMFLLFSVGLADVYVAGRFDPEVQGAVGFGSQLLFFFGVIGNSLGVGLVAIISRQMGARDVSGMWHSARQGIFLASLLTVPLSILGIVSINSPLLLSVVPPSVATVAKKLLPYYALALWPQAIITVAGAVFRARTQMLLVLVCSGGTALLNFIGDFALSFGFWSIPALGPLGIAVATAISSLAGAALGIAILIGQGLKSDGWRPDIVLMKAIARLSWPMGILQMGWYLGSIFLYGILGHLSTNAVEATAALPNGLRIEAVLYLPVYALNMIAAVLVAQAMGAGNTRKARNTGWRIARAAAVVLTVVAVPVYIYSMEIAGLITPDPIVQKMTHLYLRFNMLSQPFMALGVCLGGALEGAGDTFGVMKVVLGALWGFRLPIAAVLALATGLASNGVWLAMVLSMILQCVLMAWRYHKGRWKNVNVLADG